jgi:hypothetical protein
MATKLPLTADKRASKLKRLLLVDAAGAFLTAILLITVVAGLQAYFGMPRQVVYILALLACLYGTYSLCCYFFLKNNQAPYLKLIAVANLIYCCVIVGLLFNFYQQLTVLGLIYFSAEVMIICVLALIEFKATREEV